MNKIINRGFQSSSVIQFPRMSHQPRKQLPDTTVKSITKEQFERLKTAKLESKSKIIVFPSRKYPPLHIRQQAAPVKTRCLSSIQEPLPTTFPPGLTTEKEWKLKRSNLLPDAKITDHHCFPYRYYEIAMMKSLIGLSGKIKKIALSIGLTRRHQVWRLVSPRSAGQILKLKELVHVRLVNEVPFKYTLPMGYQKEGSMMA